MTMEEIAGKIGIATGTLYEWKKLYPEINEALKKGKELCDFEAEEALEGLFKKHILVDTIEEIYEEDGVQKKHIKKVKHEVDPNPTSIIFYLKCRAKWTENSAMLDLQKKCGELAFQSAMEEIENEKALKHGGVACKKKRSLNTDAPPQKIPGEKI